MHSAHIVWIDFLVLPLMYHEKQGVFGFALINMFVFYTILTYIQHKNVFCLFLFWSVLSGLKWSQLGKIV